MGDAGDEALIERDRVLEYLRERAGRPLKPRELARGLGVAPADYKEFRHLLRRMEHDGDVYQVRRHRYAAPEKIHLVVGRLQVTRSGAGFVLPDNGAGDVFVSSESMGSALDGDRVVVRVERRRRVPRPEGRVIKVLERARETIVGAYHPARNFGFVVPENPRITRHLFVPPGRDGGAAAGDIVVARVSDWGDEHRGPTGEVERVLGARGEPGVDTLAIFFAHELPLEFPPEVEREAEEILDRGMSPELLAGREDFRDLLVFTIDPVDARDFDDALSIRPAGDGRWEVGVHVADVSAFVTDGGAMDAEAFRRGTSVYLVDRVVPMLPDALSGDLCSLKPGEDRLAVSLVLQLDEAGEVHGHRLVRSVIRSRHRLTYEQAQAVLDGTADSDIADQETREALHRLAAISRQLRQRRFARGSLDFDLPEARVLLDTRGEPTDIQRVLRLESHRLIEDFMLLANETVAAEAARLEIPFIYRIHEPPDTDRLTQLAEFAGAFGYVVGRRGSIGPKDLQLLLERSRGRAEGNLLSTVVLRSMKRARYSHENLGHFGLATAYYTHFTSPIRRYPDLVVHRLLIRRLLGGGKGTGTTDSLDLADVANHASERERVATEAERDSIDLKKVEYMERHVGDEFDGTISGVTAFGFFVLLDDVFVEGLVHVSSLEDDYYSYLEERFELVGERAGRRFRLGDRLRVRVASVDREDRRIDFVLAEPPRRVSRPGRRGRRTIDSPRRGG